MAAEGGPVTHRVTMACGELVDVDVVRVALVDRGANRVPFRFTKRDSQEGDGVAGIDLGGFLRKKEVHPKAVEVAGIAFGADVDPDAAKALVEKAGFSTETLVETKDGGKIYSQAEGDFDPEGLTFMQLAEDWGVFLKNGGPVLKQAQETIGFSENLGAAQFIPGLFLAMDTLQSTVMRGLDEAEDKKELVTGVKNATSAFGTFVSGLAEQIPADVFKLELILAESGETQPEDKASGADGSGKDGDVQKSDSDGDGKSAAEEGKSADDVKKGDDDKKASTPDDEGKVEKSEPGDGENAVLKAIEGLGTKLDAVEKKVGEIDGKVAKATEAAEAAKELAQKHEKALAVVGGPVGDDPVLTSRQRLNVRKREGRLPLMDTSRGRPED